MNESSDVNVDPSVRYGLTALGRQALADADEKPSATAPLRRLRRTRARARMLVRIPHRP